MGLLGSNTVSNERVKGETLAFNTGVLKSVWWEIASWKYLFDWQQWELLVPADLSDKCRKYLQSVEHDLKCRTRLRPASSSQSNGKRKAQIKPKFTVEDNRVIMEWALKNLDEHRHPSKGGRFVQKPPHELEQRFPMHSQRDIKNRVSHLKRSGWKLRPQTRFGAPWTDAELAKLDTLYVDENVARGRLCETDGAKRREHQKRACSRSQKPREGTFEKARDHVSFRRDQQTSLRRGLDMGENERALPQPVLQRSN